MAKTAELDEDLVVGLKAAKSKRAYFALVLKGSSDGALILSKTKVPPAAIAEAKKKSGGSATLKGFCQYEDGKYIFETAKPAPATAAQAVKVIAKRDAGLAVHAEFRVGNDPELLAEEGDAIPPSPPPPPPPPNDGAAVIARLNALTPDIKTALAGPNKARVQALYVAISGQIKGKDFAAAGKGLDELGPLVKQTQTTAVPKDDGSAVMKRLNALTPDIKAALAGANKAHVQALFVAVNGQLKSKDFAQAAKGLDELEAALKQPGSGAALASWRAARAVALGKLKAIVAKVAAAKHPKSDKALIQLKAVVANLPAEPDTPQKVSELEQYFTNDDVVLDVCKFAADIRTPLLSAIAQLKNHFAA